MTEKVKAITEQLTALLDAHEFSREQKQTVETLYEQVLKKTFTRTGCPDCYHDAIVEALAYLRKHGDVKAETRYELIYGEYFYLGGFGSSNLIVNSTMTDDLAIQYLAETDGNGIDKFEKVPANWKEEVEAYKNRGKQTPAEAPAEQAKPRTKKNK